MNLRPSVRAAGVLHVQACRQVGLIPNWLFAFAVFVDFRVLTSGCFQSFTNILANNYDGIRRHIADALTVGVSLQSSKAKRIFLASPHIRHICGAQLMSLYWERGEVEEAPVHDSWSSCCARQS